MRAGLGLFIVLVRPVICVTLAGVPPPRSAVGPCHLRVGQRLKAVHARA